MASCCKCHIPSSVVSTLAQEHRLVQAFPNIILWCGHIDFSLMQNLDGGGSSTSVYMGKVVDKPTCVDSSVVCERAVTSIACIRNV